MRLIAIVLTAALLVAPAFAQDRKPGATVSHGLTLLEDLKYPADFKRLDYVNPDAPKGGTLRRYSIGTFDTFNPYIIKGNPSGSSSMVYQTLMDSPMDRFPRVTARSPIASR